MTLTAIADALAALGDGTATIEDAAGSAVACAGDASGTATFVAEVFADGVRLGAIRVAAMAEAGVAAALEAAAPVVARHLAARHADSAFAAFLHDPDAAGAERLGLDPDARHAVVAFAADDPPRLVRDLAVYWTAFRQRAACGLERGRAYAVLAAEQATDSVRRALDRAARGSNVRAATGPATTLADLARSRGLADQALSALVAEPHLGAVADFDDVRHKVLLAELRQATPTLALDGLSRITDHDTANNTAYVETLRAYLDAFGDVTTAAKTVSVHGRTFRYRLSRIAELSGLQLTDPDERLAVHLMLRLSDAS